MAKIIETMSRNIGRFIAWRKAKRMKRRVKQGRQKAAKERMKATAEKQQQEVEEHNRTHCDWCKSTVPKGALVCLKCNRLTDKKAQLEQEERERRQITINQKQTNKGNGTSSIFWGLFCFFILLPIGAVFLIGITVSVLEVI